MAGNQSRALIIVSKAKGWDPTVIEGGESIANFDKDNQNYRSSGDGLGKLPEGTPDTFPQAKAPEESERMTFTTPDTSRETKNRASSGADPFSGMGGTGV